MPRVSQELQLICSRCDKKDAYDVGTIFYDQEGEGPTAAGAFCFTNYFRCRQCESPGPWRIADYPRLIGMLLKLALGSTSGFAMGRCELFDGTSLQTPALGEEYLLGLIQKDPHNAFLHTRLGNLLRCSGQIPQAEEWYEKALRLDAGDIEARFHLCNFNLNSNQIPAALDHALLLVRYLLAGRKTAKDDLTCGIAEWVSQELLHAPEEFCQQLLNSQKPLTPEIAFACSLWQDEGDEDEIIYKSATCLLTGITTSSLTRLGQDLSYNADPMKINPIASLQEVIQAEGLSPETLSVPLKLEQPPQAFILNKQSVPIYDRQKLANWSVPSLRTLFRGDQSPPPDLNHYPPAYVPVFYLIENHVLTACQGLGDQTDQDLERIYSTLRRRPDGRSLGLVHDFLWQVAALTLGLYPLSQAEFEGVIGVLERSTRTWQQQPISRNYLAYLRQNLHSGS
jgi:hypothetical protein